MSKTKPSWSLPESQVTHQGDFNQRRMLLKGLGLGLAWPVLSPLETLAKTPSKVTDPTLVKSYNNYYEFSTDKSEVSRLCQGVSLGPWQIKIQGLVEKPFTLDTSKLSRLFPIEERIYRFRCVEAWSMVLPWNGFELSHLIKRAKPLSTAKYVQFEAEADSSKMPGLSRSFYPWPYTEGLRLDEATHELAFLATGMYGEALPTQNGSPLRLVVPWKYGFKSIKAIRTIRFTDQRPQTLWNQIGPKEYGFYANVNPKVDHPRWSQKSEKPLGSWFGSQPTQMFNGYEAQVASLYQGLDLRKNY